MTVVEPWMIAMGVNIALVAVAWGDLRRQVTSNRDLQDERHAETRTTLREIGDDVKQINGRVHEHSGQIRSLEGR